MDPEEVVEERLEVGESLVIEEEEVEARPAEEVVVVLVLTEPEAEGGIQAFHGLAGLEGVGHDE